MARYYVSKNAQASGGYEVHYIHTIECSRLPRRENRIYLGNFDNCHDAVRKAREFCSYVDGCYYCSRECHTG